MNRTNYGILFYLLQEVHDLYELFHTRNNLFRRAYYHKVAKAVDYMYVYNYVNLGISINFSYRCQTTNLPIRAQKKSIFKENKFLSLFSIVKTTEWNGIIKIDNYSAIYRDYLGPKFDGFRCFSIPLWRIWCMTYKYWISGVDGRAIFRVGVFRSLAFHCNILYMPWYYDRT
jgi:hypothetical protein